MQSSSGQRNLHTAVGYREEDWHWMFRSKCMVVFKVIWALSIHISEISKKELQFSIGFTCYMSDHIHWPFWSNFWKRHGVLHPSAILFLQVLQPNSIPFSIFYQFISDDSRPFGIFSFGTIFFVVGKGELQRHRPVSFMCINLRLLFIKNKSYQKVGQRFTKPCLSTFSKLQKQL